MENSSTRKYISSDVVSVSLTQAIAADKLKYRKPIRGVVEDDALSIDALMKAGLVAINHTLHALMQEINNYRPASPPRETIQNLKDVMAMLRDLKKDEKDFIDSLSDEELEKLDIK